MTLIQTDINSALGRTPSARVQHCIIGRRVGFGTSFVTLTEDSAISLYAPPTAARRIQIAGGNANDDAAGTGAQQITVVGLDEESQPAQESIATAGASASSFTTTTFTRVNGAFVSIAGSGGSNEGDVVLVAETDGTQSAFIPALASRSRGGYFSVIGGRGVQNGPFYSGAGAGAFLYGSLMINNFGSNPANVRVQLYETTYPNPNVVAAQALLLSSVAVGLHNIPIGPILLRGPQGAVINEPGSQLDISLEAQATTATTSVEACASIYAESNT